MPASQPQRLHQSEPRDWQKARGVPGQHDGRSAASTVCHETSQTSLIKHDLTIFASHFRDRVNLFKKVPHGARLISTRRRPPRVFCHTRAHVPEGKFLVRGCSRSARAVSPIGPHGDTPGRGFVTLSFQPRNFDWKQTRGRLRLVDISRTPVGTFFSKVHPSSEMASKNHQTVASYQVFNVKSAQI